MNDQMFGQVEDLSHSNTNSTVAPGNRYPGPDPLGNPFFSRVVSSLLNPQLSVAYPSQGAKYGFGQMRSLMADRRPDVPSGFNPRRMGEYANDLIS